MINKKEYINIPLEFEWFLSHIFDKQSYHGYVGNKSFNIWKKTHEKLLNFLDDIIHKNIKTDITHMKELETLLKYYLEGIKKFNSFDELNILSLQCLYKIIFTIIGNIPDNRNAKPQNRNKFLGKFRTINYSQNIDQKVETIQQEVSNYCNLSSNDIWIKRLEFGLDSKKFLKWFKEEYPIIYCKLF